jgi:hypothetical protein
MALDLYRIAERNLQTSTREALRQEDLIVCGVWHGAFSSKATFYRAFQEGVPVVLKIYHDPRRAEVEYDDILQVMERGGALEKHFLVPVTQKKFCYLSSRPARCAPICTALISPPYSCTANDFPLPMPPAYAVRIGECVLKALKHLWECGFAFCDTKPANIFLCGESAYFGDFGGMTKLGDVPTESTEAYVPMDIVEVSANQILDRWMLVATMLELCDSTLELPMDRASLMRQVNELSDAGLSLFLRQVACAEGMHDF